MPSAGREWPAWHAEISNYRDPNTFTATWQLLSMLCPYCCWLLTVQSVRLGHPYAVTLALAFLAAALLVRLFTWDEDRMALVGFRACDRAAKG